jgi:type IV secretion system protein VirB11
LLSGTLPNGFRIQVVISPACEVGTIGISIRKPSTMNLDLNAYEKLGAFDNTAIEKVVDKNDSILNQYLKEKKIKEFLTHAVINLSCR